jgi:hypothetical protein
VYTYNYGYVQATSTEGRLYITSINSYRSYLCSQNSFHGIKVISRQRQLQSMNNTRLFTEHAIYCYYSIQVSIHVVIITVDVLTFACSVLPIPMATLVPVTVEHSCYQTKETVLSVHNNLKIYKV